MDTITHISRDLIVTTDDYLDRLAETFSRLKINRLLGGLTFGQYISNPDKYDELAGHLLAGNGLQANDRITGLLLVELPGAANA